MLNSEKNCNTGKIVVVFFFTLWLYPEHYIVEPRCCLNLLAHSEVFQMALCLRVHEVGTVEYAAQGLREGDTQRKRGVSRKIKVC